MIKIALIELGGSHDECLYSQAKFLKTIPEVHLTFIADAAVAKKTTELHHYIDESIVLKVSKGLKEWKQMYELYKIIDRNKFDKVLLNTAQSSQSKKLCFFMGKKAEVYGILHNVKKLEGSIGQKIISRSVKGYFVLNDYLLDKIPQKSSTKFQSFYPIFFPPFAAGNLYKPKDEIWICIPGQVEEKRRDYHALLKELAKKKIHENIKFILLGRIRGAYALSVKQQIEDLELQHQFVYWNEFVPNNLFHAFLQKSDFVMPLIHKNHVCFSYYEYRISGSFNLAFAYRKPLLMEDSFMKYKDFEENAIFYRLSSLSETINNLEKIDTTTFYKEDKWSFEFQKTSYLRFLFEK